VKLLNDGAYRLDWAERLGTGFVLPVGQPGLLHVVRKLRKLLKRLVDERGFEPPASSLRMRFAALKTNHLRRK
jgi:hypothetical protein